MATLLVWLALSLVSSVHGTVRGKKRDQLSFYRSRSIQLVPPPPLPCVSFAEPLMFRCSDGFTIPTYLICDGIADCMDGADEQQRNCGTWKYPASGTQSWNDLILRHSVFFFPSPTRTNCSFIKYDVTRRLVVVLVAVYCRILTSRILLYRSSAGVLSTGLWLWAATNPREANPVHPPVVEVRRTNRLLEWQGRTWLWWVSSSLYARNDT